MIDHLEDSIIYPHENYMVPHLMNNSRNNTIYFQNENDSIQDNAHSIMEVLNRYPGTKLQTNPDGSKRLGKFIHIYKVIHQNPRN